MPVIINPTYTDFENSQERGLDYQEYRSTWDLLHLFGVYFHILFLRNTETFPVECITEGLVTSAWHQDDSGTEKLHIHVLEGACIKDNEPLLFQSDYEFTYDIPTSTTTYYVYVRYRYVPEYTPNIGEVVITTAPQTSYEYMLIARVAVDPTAVVIGNNDSGIDVDLTPYDDLTNWGIIYALNIRGGDTNQIIYQTAPSTTGFIDAPTSDKTFLMWNDTLSQFVWSTPQGGNADTLDDLDSTQFLRSDIDDTANGSITFAGGGDVAGGNDGGIIVGDSSAKNITIDDDSIQARDNGSPSTLTLNPLGGDVNIKGSTTINGDLTVTGTHTWVDVSDLDIKDNIIVLNKGETGSGVTLGQAGIQIDRGTATDAKLVYNDSVDRWMIDNGDSNLYYIAYSTDESGTGLNADTLDGRDSTEFAWSANNDPYQISVKDTRNDDTPTDLGEKAALFEFKKNSTDGVNDGGTYHGVLTFQPWSDSGGGKTHQLAFTDNNNLWLRSSNIGGSWGSWVKVWTTGNDGSGSGLDADTVDGIQGDHIFEAARGLLTSGDWNNYTTHGVYKVQHSNFDNDTNNPPASYPFGILEVIRSQFGGENRLMQIYTPHHSDEYIYQRMYNNGSWTSWYKIWRSGSGSGSALDADTVDGLHANQFIRSDVDDTWDGVLSTTQNGYRITFQPSSSGGNVGIKFNSKVNAGSDYGYILWYDDNNSYNFWGDSNENGALVIGVENDGRASGSDVVVLKSPAAAIADTQLFIVRPVTQDGDSVLEVKANDSYQAYVNIIGNNQGTGWLYVGQSLNYGGGIIYNGDDNPDIFAPSDAITFYRRSGGSNSTVFYYYHNGNRVYYTGDIAIHDSNTLIQKGANNSIRLRTNYGYVDIGPQNSTYCHFSTDRSYFNFNKSVRIGEFNNPWLTIDSPGSGSTGSDQAAGLSIGVSGYKGNAAIHITYTGDGYAHIGMGNVDSSTSLPAHEAMRLHYTDNHVNFLGEIWIHDDNTKIQEGNGNSVRIRTDSGYVDIGPQNTSHCHIETDRPDFWFNKDLYTWRNNGTNYAKVQAWAYRAISSNVTAISWDYLLVDTSGGVVTVTLPASPQDFDKVYFVDLKGTFDTNKLTVARNGKTIMGLSEDMDVTSKNVSFGLIYYNGDWRVVNE